MIRNRLTSLHYGSWRVSVSGRHTGSSSWPHSTLCTQMMQGHSEGWIFDQIFIQTLSVGRSAASSSMFWLRRRCTRTDFISWCDLKSLKEILHHCFLIQIPEDYFWWSPSPQTRSIVVSVGLSSRLSRLFSSICCCRMLAVRDRNILSSVVKICSEITGVKQTDLSSFCNQPILLKAASISVLDVFSLRYDLLTYTPCPSLPLQSDC